MRRIVLLTISLSLTACASGWPSWAPKPPHGVQYGVHADVNPPGFYGVHTKTKARVYRPFDDPAMKGAQAVDADYYREGERWIKEVQKAVRNHCK